MEENAIYAVLADISLHQERSGTAEDRTVFWQSLNCKERGRHGTGITDIIIFITCKKADIGALG